MVCLRNICINTLHKGDNDDNNNNKYDFCLEKCARMCLKRGRVQSKMHVGNTFENDIKELDPRKACKYLGIEESF
jgi:hypothetical protein